METSETTASTTYSIDIRGVAKSFGSIAALSEVSLRLPTTSIGLLGPNGAGKSTLMKILLGLIAPDRGEVRVFDIDVVHKPFLARRSIGFMSEGDAVLPATSALDYVTLAAELCGLPQRDAQARAQQVLNYVGLGEARYRNVEEFSTGMRQRARLAQAIVAAPRLLLLDEPTSGLDPDGRDEMLALIKDIPKRTGATVLLSTHILPDVEKTCDHVVVLASGKVLYDGALAPLVAEKQNTFVVEVKGDRAQFRRELEIAQCIVTDDPRGLTVRVPSASTEPTMVILRASKSANVAVRHLAPFKQSLETAFFATLSEEKKPS